MYQSVFFFFVSVLNESSSWNLNRLIERDKMRGDGRNVSADANISCLELRLVTNLSSCSQSLDLGHERSAALACIAHEVSDLSLLREIVE